MIKRKNTSPPLGPDTCGMDGCGALAQTTLSATGETLRSLGFPMPTLALSEHREVERVAMRVCMKCYLRAMAEVQARARTPLTGIAFQALSVASSAYRLK